MGFHRLTNPSYFFTGGVNVPATYDKLNDPTDPSVGDTGVAAIVDTGRKSSGPNKGSYFFTFGEDAVTSHNNRGLYALAENTDILDDVVMASIPRVFITGSTTPGFSVGTLALTGQIFVGAAGTSNTQGQRDRLVRIVDDEYNELEVGGVFVAVTLIHDGSNNNVVGTASDGFYSNPTITISPAIPSGQPYRVVYGVRSGVKDISFNNIGAPISPHLGLLGAMRWEVRKLLRELHAAPAVGQSWDTTWDSTIRAVASGGLNERYRRSTSQPSGFVTGDYNTPGGGSTIIRDGKAVEVRYTDLNYSNAATVYAPDPILASYRVGSSISAGTGTWPNLSKGGNIGLFQEISHRSTTDTNERVRSEMSGPLLMEAVARDIRIDTLSASTANTHINRTLVGKANPLSGTSADDRRTLECASGDAFVTGIFSLIRRWLDIIEVTDDATGQVIGSYYVTDMLSTTQLQVVTLAGANPDFGATARNVRLRWLQPTVLVGGGLGTVGNAEVVGAGVVVTQIPHVTDTLVAERDVPPAITALSDSAETGTARSYAMSWGCIQDSLAIRETSIYGYLEGNGGLTSLNGRIRRQFDCLEQSVYTGAQTSSFTHTWDPFSGANLYRRIDSSSAAVTMTLQLAGGFTPIKGDKLRLTLEILGGSDHAVGVVWPTDFYFQDGDQDVPGYNNNSSSIYVIYEFEYSHFNGVTPVWFASRKDYN